MTITEAARAASLREWATVARLVFACLAGMSIILTGLGILHAVPPWWACWLAIVPAWIARWLANRLDGRAAREAGVR